MPLFGRRRQQQVDKEGKRLALRALAGELFDEMVGDGARIAPDCWVNKALHKNPWEEGPAAVAAMREFNAPLKDKQDVSLALAPLKEPLEAAERGELAAASLRELHEIVTTIIRAKFLTDAVSLVERHSVLQTEYESLDEAERAAFSVLQGDMNGFEEMLFLKGSVPLFLVIKACCLDISLARDKWDKAFSDEASR